MTHGNNSSSKRKAESNTDEQEKREQGRMMGTGSARVLSWSSDGSLCEWDLENSTGIITEPLNRLVVKDHPFYCCAASSSAVNPCSSDGDSASPASVLVACAGGGGGNGGFMGIPVHLARYTPGNYPQA